ncbi:MAG: TonB-dependent receptor plug domain-containing protein, partial [Candidatus Latescibacteria bacterium]|nr:TonB-dependent receptor plug domain-containing protein [bacterium]MBD3423918.1 TonB-dependent receptor plug domain-containing protein [Candidatus Latescibacterota bacterium]
MSFLNAVFRERTRFWAIFILILFSPVVLFAEEMGILAGKVINVKNNLPVFEALVKVQGTDITTLTDQSGMFRIKLPEGKHSISVHKPEYFTTCLQDIIVEGGKITTYQCEMATGDPEMNLFFMIGGITVLGERELLPEEVETVHEISSDEIEHQLSTNLGDILDLVPGVERTSSPGLSEMSQVQLRGSGFVEDRQEALFGTKIIVDDVPISNNANLQAGTGTSMSGSKSYAGEGIDLRTIPADNIEKVEVITGVPSVEYGDLTSGLVKVRTKSGAQPHRIKIKSNPDTKEANLSGGWGFDYKNSSLAYNLNGAFSERNIRREGDEYYRYNGQLTLKNELMDGDLKLMNKLYYHGVNDDQDFKKDDPLSVIQYNDDKTYIYGQRVDYRINQESKLEWNANIKYTDRDSYRQSLTGADTRVLTDALTDGTRFGVLDAGAYLYKIWTRGQEWSVNAKLNFRHDFQLFDLGNYLLLGAEYSFDANKGEGKVFDPLKPPYGSPGRRPHPFDASPDLHVANIYLEDEINGFLRMRPYQINLGLRYEMYSPHKLHLGGIFGDEGIVESKNGTYLNPRIRAKYEIRDGTQIRAGWGRSSKMPSMTKIYQKPEYVDIVEETPADSVPLISTYVYNFNTRNVKGYQNQKGEISLDQKIGPVGLIFTGFFTNSSDIPRGVASPQILYRYSYDEDTYPSGDPTVIDTFYNTSDSDRYQSAGWYKNYGFEFQLRTKRIKKLNTKFYVSASFTKSRSGGDGIYMSSARDNEILGRTIFPYYPYTESWRHKMIVNYRADWLIEKLGMWVTLHLQQTLFDANKNALEKRTYSTGYYDPSTGQYESVSPA